MNTVDDTSVPEINAAFTALIVAGWHDDAGRFRSDDEYDEWQIANARARQERIAQMERDAASEDLAAVARDFGMTAQELEQLRADVLADDEGLEAEWTSWRPVDLSAAFDDADANDAPTMLETTDNRFLVYSARIHWVSGEPETCKTWFAFLAALWVIRNGGTVAVIDFEDSVRNAVKRFRALGLTDAEIVQHLRYIAPSERLEGRAFTDLELAILGVDLVIVDACSEAMSLAGLDTYSNPDAVRWFTEFVRPLTTRGAAVIVIDHVAKAKDSRGRYSLGAQHKLAGLDGAAYVLDVIEPFAPGHDGRIKVTISKDRPGHVRGGAAGKKVAGEMVLTSDAQDGSVTIEVRPSANETADGKFRPTTLMERVSRYLEGELLPVTTNDVTTNVDGNSNHLRTALGALVSEGFVQSELGQRNSKRLTSIRPFRQADHVRPEMTTDPIFGDRDQPRSHRD